MTKVIYYTTITGESPAKNFITSLLPAQKAKITRIFAYIEEYGLVAAIPHIKKLTGTFLWEIRILGQDNIRVLYATIGKDGILILHGFMKKKQKTPPGEISTALNHLDEWTTRKQKGS